MSAYKPQVPRDFRLLNTCANGTADELRALADSAVMLTGPKGDAYRAWIASEYERRAAPGHPRHIRSQVVTS